MTAINWKSGVNGSWDTPGNWSGGAVPTSADDVTIAATGNYTITISGAADSAHSLTLNAAGATLLDQSPQFFTIGSALTVTAGTLELTNLTEVTSSSTGSFKLSSGGTLLAGTGGGSLQFGTITTAGLINTGTAGLSLSTFAGGLSTLGGTLTGTGGLDLGPGGGFVLASAGLAGTSAILLQQATLSLSANETLASALSGYGATLSIGKSLVLTETGALSLSTSPTSQTAFTLSGAGKLVTQAASTVGDLNSKGQSVELTGGFIWSNSGAVTDNGNIAFNDSSVSADTATIVNNAAGTFNIAGADANLILNGTGTDLFTNAGTLSRGGDSNVSTLAAQLNSTGTINITAGELDATGGGTVSGTLTGPGVFSLAGGTFTLGATGLAGTGNLEINGSTLSAGASNTLAGSLSAFQGTLTVAKGATETLSGAVQFAEPAFDFPGFNLSGLGTVSTSNTVTIGNDSLYGLVIGGGVTWTNSGTVNDGNGVQFGSGQTATILNSVTGVFNAGYLGVYSDGTGSALFTNAGTLNAGGPSGSATFAVPINSTGTINVTTGIVDMSGGGTISGTLSGSGTLSLDSGSYTIGNLVGTGTIRDNGATVNYLNSTISTAYTLDDNQALVIASGKTLTLSGPFTIGDATGGGVIEGPGTLVTTGATTIADIGAGAEVLGLFASLIWKNSGTVNDSGYGLLDATGGGSPPTISNSGTFNFVGDDSAFVLNTQGGGSPTGTFTNTGVLAKTSGTGTSTFAGKVIDSATVNVASGMLALSGGGSLAGTLTGAGTLALTGGAFTTTGLTGAGTLSVSTASLAASATGAITDAVIAGNAGTISAATGKTLTLSGPVTIGNATGGGVVLSGPGTVATTGTTTIADIGAGAVVVNVTSNWVNSGTVNDAGYGFLDVAGGGSPGIITNSGTFNFVGDDSALVLDQQGGGAPAGTFTSTGVLAKTSGTGTSTIGGRVVQSGTTNIASGTLALLGGGTESGTLTGSGVLDLGGGAFTTTGLSGAGTLAVTSASLTATVISAITESVLVANAGTLAAATGKTLTLSGPVTIGNATGGGVVLSGPGTIATTGTTTIADIGAGAVVLNVAGSWTNSGTVNDAGYGFLDVAGGGSPGIITNSGTFNLVGDDSALVLDQQGGGSPAGTFTSTGVLAKTSGTGTSTIGGRVVQSGTTNVTSGTLALTGGGSLSGALTGPGTLALTAGAFTTTGLSGGGTLAVTTASLTASATSTITASVVAANAGTIAAATGKTLTLSGPVAIGNASGGGVVLSGPGTIATTGTTTIADIGAGAVVLNVAGNWANSGTVNDAGYGFLDIAGGGSPGIITNTGTFNFVGDDSALVLDTQGGGSPAGTFTNAGTLAKTSGIGTSTLGASIAGSGTIAVASGTLALTGGGAVSGAVSGAGVLALQTGTFTTTGISGAGNLAITGSNTSLTQAASGTISTAFLASGGATLVVSPAATNLALTGPVTFGDATGYGDIYGPGTITTTGATSISDDGAGNFSLLLDGGVTWANSGTVTDAGFVAIANSGTTITVTNSGTFNLTTADSGGFSASTFTNTGLLAKTSATGIGTTTIGAVIASTGTIAVASGTLALGNGGTLGGSLSGAGALAVTYGTFTTNGLSGTGTLQVYSAGGFDGVGTAQLQNTANATITDTVDIGSLSTIAPAAGTTITFSGPVQFGNSSGYARLVGSGTVATTGAVQVVDAGVALDVDGGATWINSGTVTMAGVTYVGPSSTITNLTGGVINLTTDDAAITYASTPAGQLNNAGLIAKTGGTATSVIITAITNTGTIEANHGTLSLQAGVTGTGALKIDAGATLDITGAIPASEKISFTGGAGATLKLENPASIGTLTGFTAGDRLDLGSATATSTKISGNTLSVVTTGGTLTYVSAGLAGEVATIASDGNSGSYVSLYRGAIATHTPEPLAFGNFHVGSTVGTTASLTVSNVAPADGYSEKLNAGFGSASAGFSAAGTVSGIAAGASNSTSLTASISTATAGAKSGTATLTLASNGSGVDGRGTTALTPQTVNLTGGVYALAAGTLASTSVTLGNHHVGDRTGGLLTVTNSGPATGGFTEALDVSFTGSSGGATGSGSVSLLSVGASNSTSLAVGLGLAGAGVVSGSEILTYVSDGTGTSGLGTTTLGTQAVSISGTYFNLAAGTPATTVLALGNHHVGDTVGGVSLALTNSAAAGAYSEALDASLAASGALTASGTISGLLAGNTDSTTFKIGETAATAGAITGSLVLGLTSDGTAIGDGLGTTTLAGQTITVTGANYALAAAQTGGTVNLGVIHASTTATGALSLSNIAAAGAYSEALDASITGLSAGLSASGSLTGLLAGQTNASALLLSLNTATTGSYTGTGTLNLASDGTVIGDGLGTTTLAGQTVTLTATVDNYALAAFEDPSGPALTGTSTNETLNLGSALQGSNALTATIGVLNAATGLSDLLLGTLTGAGATGFTNSGLGSFSGLGAGQDEHAQAVSLSTSTTGTFTETIVLSSAGTNASGYNGALANETLTITGTITPSVTTTYTLDSGPNIIVGANGAGDIFNAIGGSLNSRDQLTGGSGANVLNLIGGGTFDVNAPKVFSNIPTINATEGQAASGTLANTVQTVLMTDAANETLNVATGKAATGNSNAETIRIYGSSSTDTYNLASGTDKLILSTGQDTITLGGTANSVTAGGGTALVHSTAAFAGAAIVGAATGSTLLDITTAGTVTLNAADTHITARLDAAGSLKLSALSFINGIGSSGADTITALAGTQSLTGGLGADVLVGYTGGNDTFIDTAAGLNGDTIKNWAAGDIIDVTNISAAGLQTPTFASSTLTLTDGTNTAAIKFANTVALHNFTVLGSDGSGGVLLGYHT